MGTDGLHHVFKECIQRFVVVVLRVSGKMDVAYEHRKDAVYHVKELTRKGFVRTMLLPEYVKSDPVASYHHGMLTLTFDLPKKEEVKPQVKSIPILTKEEK
jgi:HSP20 family molecular chaperone IbpA